MIGMLLLERMLIIQSGLFETKTIGLALAFTTSLVLVVMLLKLLKLLFTTVMVNVSMIQMAMEFVMS